jgi:hypothetical protein
MVAQNCVFDNVKLRYFAEDNGRTSPKMKDLLSGYLFTATVSKGFVACYLKLRSHAKHQPIGR